MFAALRSIFSFPLLSKELTERAARPRTYWIRFATAIALYAGFWFSIGKRFTSGTLDPMSVLGSGAAMLKLIVAALFIAIYALVPAILCGVVTQEKERDSLVLLLLTNLRPWQIAIQKYLGGLVPALTFLLLGMPLVAVAFAYGGVTTGQLALTLGILVFAVFQIGAIALWASCWCRTTVSAFLTTYAVTAAVAFLPMLFDLVNSEFALRLLNYKSRWLLLQHVPPAAILDLYLSNYGLKWGYLGLPVAAVPFVHIGATTLLFLLAAIWHLPRRAFTQSRHWLRRSFAAIDRWVHRANRFVGSVRFGRKPMELPDHLPLVWREKRTRALAQPEHLVRLLVIVMTPLAFFVLASLATNASSRELDNLSIAAVITGGLAVLTLSTTAANSIVNERVNQTFEILLTTPMSAASMLRQKALALRPLAFVAGFPVLSIFILEGILEAQNRREYYGYKDWSSVWLYFVCAVLTVVVNLPLVTWLSIWIGLKCKTRIRAISLTLTAIALWSALPVFILEAANVSTRRFPERYLYFSSPLYLPAANEFHAINQIEPDAPWLPVILNFTLYGGILFAIRRHCLRNADEYLRR